VTITGLKRAPKAVGGWDRAWGGKRIKKKTNWSKETGTREGQERNIVLVCREAWAPSSWEKEMLQVKPAECGFRKERVGKKNPPVALGNKTTVKKKTKGGKLQG